MKDELSLFTATFSQTGEKYFPKVKMGDGWGSTCFIIKGEIPAWVQKAKIPVYAGKDKDTYAKLAKSTISSYVQNYIPDYHTSYKEVKRVDICVLLNRENEKLVEVAKLSIGKKYRCIRRDFHKLFTSEYPDLRYYMHDTRWAIIVLDKDEIVGAIASIQIPDDHKLVSPIEALREMANKISKENEEKHDITYSNI